MLESVISDNEGERLGQKHLRCHDEFPFKFRVPKAKFSIVLVHKATNIQATTMAITTVMKVISLSAF